MSTVPMLEYRNDPSLTIDEVARRIASKNITWPVMTAPPTPISVADLKTLMIMAVHQIQQRVLEVPGIIVRLREYTSHILWMVREGRELTQLEKTWIMHARHPKYGVSKMLGEDRLPQSISKPNEMRLLDPSQALAALSAVSQPGPKMNYMVQHSNTDLEDLVIYRGLWSPALAVAAGVKLKFGPFTTLDLKIKHQINWSPESVLRGTIEAGFEGNDYQTEGTNGNAKNGLYPTLSVALDDDVMTAQGVKMLYDMPEVKVIWRDDELAYQYHASWRNRTLETRDPSDFLISQALTAPQLGQAKMNSLTLDQWTLCDTWLLDASTDFKTFEDFEDEDTGTTMNAWYVKRHRKGATSPLEYMSEREIDMKPFMMY
jgi:hypothetical protein